jgi:cytochrome c-type biogenesis protein
VYCAGLGVPFIIAGLAFGTVSSSLAVVRRHYSFVIFAGGGILIFMGVLVFTGEFTQMNVAVSHWLDSLGMPNLSNDT